MGHKFFDQNETHQNEHNLTREQNIIGKKEEVTEKQDTQRIKVTENNHFKRLKKIFFLLYLHFEEINKIR